MATGGLLHPHVPEATAAQMGVVAGNQRWLHSHWALTLAQPLAIAALFLLADRLRGGRRRPALWVGALLAAAGFLVGTLGTLSAATALPVAAEAGDEGLYATVNAFTLGLGWVCLVLAGTGGLLLGSRIVSLGEARGVQAIGWTVLGLCTPLVAAMAVLSPSHPWTHDLVLRASAVIAGLLFAATGAWLGLASGEASLDQATLEDA